MTFVKRGHIKDGPYLYTISVQDDGAFFISLFDQNEDWLATFQMNEDNLREFEIRFMPEATVGDIYGEYGGLCSVGYCRSGFCDAPSDQPSDSRVSARE